MGKVNLVRGRLGREAPIDLAGYEISYPARERLQQLRLFRGLATADKVA